MKGLFDYDGTVMQFLGKVTDLMILNVLTVLCCLPIFTIGAALTAAHYTALRICRNTEGRVAQNFFKSFRQNFKQSTVIWLLLIVVALFLGYDLYITSQFDSNLIHASRVAIMLSMVLVVFVFTWVFPLQAKFINTTWATIRNAFVLSMAHFIRTIGMIFAGLLPVLLLVIGFRVTPIFLAFGISLPVYLGTLIYDKVFKKMEDMILEKQGEGQPKEEVEGE